MTRIRSITYRLAPVALALATGACFATRNDVRILQEDVAAVRAATLRADSARAAQIAEVASTLRAVTDSVRSANERVARWQANAQGNLRSIQEQLLQIQELTGQSAAKLTDLRREMEERNAQIAPHD